MALFIDEQLPNFKKLRKDKKLTLRQVEEITGISNAYLSQLENGKIKSPSFDTVIKLLKIYIEPASGMEKLYSENGNCTIFDVRRSAFKPHIWHTSPACKMTFEELIKEINELTNKIETLERRNAKY